jgi:hypothetical protein
MTFDGLVQLTADLVVPPGIALTLKPGSIVVAGAEDDRLGGGADTDGVELIGLGPVWVQGTASDPVKFTSSRSTDFKNQEFRNWAPETDTAAPGDWYGYRAKAANLLNQGTLDHAEFEFAKFAVSVDSLSGNLFHPKFTSSEVADVYLDRDLRIPEDRSWLIDAPAEFMISNNDSGGSGGDSDRIEGLVEGRFESVSQDPGSDWVTILPQTLTPSTGDAWVGFTVLPGGKFKLRDAEVGYAQWPIQLIGADSCEVVRTYVHHYENEGILDWATGARIEGCRVERGVGLGEFRGVTGIHLASSAGTVLADTVGAHIDYGIKAEFSSGACGTPGLTPLGTLTIAENRIVADEEPEVGNGLDSGLFVTWVCDSISATIDHNLVKYWTRGVTLDRCSDTNVTCNTLQDNYFGLRYNRGASVPVTARDGLVKVNQSAFLSNFGSGFEIPQGLGLRVGDSASPPDPGKNTLQLDESAGGTSYIAVEAVDPSVPSSTLNAGRNTWHEADGDITQDQNYIRNHIAEEFFAQVLTTNPRSTDGLCDEMPSGTTSGIGPDRALVADGDGESIEADGRGHPRRFDLRTVGLYAPGRVLDVEFDVPRASTGATRIELFDVTGRRVRTLTDSRVDVGRYRVTWDGFDSEGNSVRPGVLFLRMVSGDFVATRKIVILGVGR